MNLWNSLEEIPFVIRALLVCVAVCAAVEFGFNG